MKTSLFSLGLTVAVALGGRAASPEPALELMLPEHGALASVDQSLLAPDAFIESDSGNVAPAEPLDGPIQPLGGAPSEEAKPLQRPWDAQFRLRLSAIHDDNIFIQNRDKEEDMVFHVTPGMTWIAGDTTLEGSFVSLRYDADAIFFLDHSDLNSVDHDVLLRGQWQSGRLTLGGFFQFQDLTGTNNDVGDRVNRKLYTGGVNARWKWSDKTALEIEEETRKSDYETQVDTVESLVRTWVEYEYSPLTAVSGGVTAGTVEVADSGRQNYVQALARVKYSAASKVKVQMRAGVELRDYERGGSAATPVFNVGAVYTPSDLLDVRLDAYRNVQPSVSTAGANTIVTGVSAGVGYRFLRQFRASVAGGYEHTEYRQEGGDAIDPRSDDYFFVRGGLQYAIGDHCGIGAFYEYRRNDSSQNERSFENNQIGLEMTVSF